MLFDTFEAFAILSDKIRFLTRSTKPYDIADDSIELSSLIFELFKLRWGTSKFRDEIKYLLTFSNSSLREANDSDCDRKRICHFVCSSNCDPNSDWEYACWARGQSYRQYKQEGLAPGPGPGFLIHRLDYLGPLQLHFCGTCRRMSTRILSPSTQVYYKIGNPLVEGAAVALPCALLMHVLVDSDRAG